MCGMLLTKMPNHVSSFEGQTIDKQDVEDQQAIFYLVQICGVRLLSWWLKRTILDNYALITAVYVRFTEKTFVHCKVGALDSLQCASYHFGTFYFLNVRPKGQGQKAT